MLRKNLSIMNNGGEYYREKNDLIDSLSRSARISFGKYTINGLKVFI